MRFGRDSDKSLLPRRRQKALDNVTSMESTLTAHVGIPEVGRDIALSGGMLRIGLFALVCALALPSSAKAGVLYSGTGTGANGITLNASALFEISGTTLTITLMNTGDTSGTGKNSDVSGNTLTGVFFDLPTGITLTPVSATIDSADLLQESTCAPVACSSSTTNVGGEFRYATGTWAGHLGNSGIASSGYVSGSSGNFNGPDLDTPGSLDGINFGIIAPQTATNAFKPNGGLANDPLIEGQVVFTMTIAGGTLSDGDISNVSFQYGTSITEPHFGGGEEPQNPIPEPATLLLLAPALAFGIRRRLRARHTAAQ